MPSVAEQLILLDDVAGDDWWVDVTLPLLEVARLRIRGLVRFVDKTRQNPIYTDFEDTLDDPAPIDLPHVTPALNRERSQVKATAYLCEHEDHVALQRLRRNKQLTPDDLTALEDMLLASGAGAQVDIEWASERTGGLGLFVRSLVGLDRAAATEAFARYLDGTAFSVDQVRFVSLIVDELTVNGVVEPARLFESPYSDHGHVDLVFPHDLDTIVEILADVKATAVPGGAA